MENNYKNYDLNSERNNPYSYQEQKINDPKTQELEATNTYTAQPTDVNGSYDTKNTYGNHMYDPQNPDLNNPYFDQPYDQGQVHRQSEIRDANWEYGSSKVQNSRPDIAALIFGVFSIFLVCLQPIGIIFAILAIICAIMSGGLQTKGRNGMAIAGIICGAIGISISLIFFIIFHLN